HRLDHRARLLRSRSAVEVDQRMPVRSLVQNRKILTKSAPVHLARDSLMHAIICYTSGGAPAHSQRTAVSARKIVAALLCEGPDVADRATATGQSCRGVCAKRLAKFARMSLQF